MLVAVIASLAMIAVIERYTRGSHLELAQLRTRYRLFALRDRLRREAFAGAIPCDDWFKYMDTTLTRTIDSLSDVNVWKALAYFAVYGRMDDAEEAQAALQKAVSRNDAFRRIYDDYKRLLWELVEERHVLVRNLPRYLYALARLLRMFDGSFSLLRRSKEHALDGLITAPSTSTLLEYAPARSRRAA
jgi:hypothetical protein